jgi:hypothetical protein
LLSLEGLSAESLLFPLVAWLFVGFATCVLFSTLRGDSFCSIGALGKFVGRADWKNQSLPLSTYHPGLALRVRNPFYLTRPYRTREQHELLLRDKMKMRFSLKNPGRGASGVFIYTKRKRTRVTTCACAKPQRQTESTEQTGL